MKQALLRETVASAAEELLREFEIVAEIVGVDDDAREAADLEDQIRSQLRTTMPINDEVVAGETDEFIHQMLLAWMQALSITMDREPYASGAEALLLDGRLVPRRESGEHWEAFQGLFARFPLDQEEQDQLMNRLATALIPNPQSGESPLGMEVVAEWRDDTVATIKVRRTS